MRGSMLVALLLGVLSAIPTLAGPVVIQPTRNINPQKTGVYSTGIKNPNPNVTITWLQPYNPYKVGVPAVEVAYIPGEDDKFLFLGRYIKTKGTLPYKEYLAAVFDLKSGTLTNISSDSDLFCGHICPTHDGKLLLVGGSGPLETGFVDGLRHVRLWSYRGANGKPDDIKFLANMTNGRWYPSTTLMPDKTILIQGGVQEAKEAGKRSLIIERWNPAQPALMPMPKIVIEPGFKATMGSNMFPGQFVLGTGDVFILQDSLVRFLTPSGTYRLDVPNVPAFPSKIATQWPRSGTLVMGPLTSNDNFSSVEIIVMGGTPYDAPCTQGPPGNAVVASRDIYTLRIQWTVDPVTKRPTYTFPDGKWNYEDMEIPRTGGDGTLTAFGDIILTSGSQRGCHGQPAPDAWTSPTRNSYPAFWPILYQTDRTLGRRVTIMEASTIARVYHMASALTMDGHIMVVGCDACNPSPNFVAGIDPKTMSWWSPSFTGRRDFRTEILQHPFSMDAANRPNFASIQVGSAVSTNNSAVVKVTYGQQITIKWVANMAGQGCKVTRVTLVAPTSATHGYNTNQRVIKLRTVSKTGNTLVVEMPPTANVAPPQMYMMFLLNEKTNSRARWVHLG